MLTTANEDEIDLPRGLLEAVDLFENDAALRDMLGDAFVSTYAAIKKAELRFNTEYADVLRRARDSADRRVM